MGQDTKTYFSPEFLEVLKQQMFMSEETWHKVMNPFCGQCLVERGREFVRKAEDGQ